MAQYIHKDNKKVCTLVLSIHHSTASYCLTTCIKRFTLSPVLFPGLTVCKLIFFHTFSLSPSGIHQTGHVRVPRETWSRLEMIQNHLTMSHRPTAFLHIIRNLSSKLLLSINPQAIEIHRVVQLAINCNRLTDCVTVHTLTKYTWRNWHTTRKHVLAYNIRIIRIHVNNN